MIPVVICKRTLAHLPIQVIIILIRHTPLSFFYHLVSNSSLPHINELYSYKTLEEFEHDLVFLFKHFTFISYNQLLSYHQGNTSLPRNSIFLSFDDGLHECFTVVRPILLRYGVPCTFFITTDLIDNKGLFYRHQISLCINKIKECEKYWKEAVQTKLSSRFKRPFQNEQDLIDWLKSLNYEDRVLIDTVSEILEIDVAKFLQENKPYLSREEIQIMAADGFTIGSHSKSHPLLEKLPADLIEREIVESCELIHEITGAEKIPFSFPFHGNNINLALLEDISVRNPIIGIMFDSTGILKRRGLILNRIWSDSPELSGNKSNIKFLLVNAYSDYLYYLINNIIKNIRIALNLKDIIKIFKK